VVFWADMGEFVGSDGGWADPTVTGPAPQSH